MDDDPSATLLVEAAMLITATRLRIARSMTLLAKVALDGVRIPRGAMAPAIFARRAPNGAPHAGTSQH